MTKDYFVEIKIKNNYLMRAMHRAGIFTAADLSRASKVTQTKVGKYLNLSFAPLNEAGEWRADVIRISETLKCLPEDLFPKQHISTPLVKNKASFEASIDDVSEFLSGNASTARTPIERIIEDEDKTIIQRVLTNTLTTREERIIRLRFGIDMDEDATLEVVAKEFDTTRERIRQIEAKAIRKLMHPRASKWLRDIFPGKGKTLPATPDTRFYVPEWKKDGAA